MIVPRHFTLWQAAASARTQAFLLVGTLVLLPVILMYTGGPIGCSAARCAATSAMTEIHHRRSGAEGDPGPAKALRKVFPTSKKPDSSPWHMQVARVRRPNVRFREETNIA